MRTKRLRRRTFLAGAGATVGLPLLQTMQAQAGGQPAPSRFLVIFCGTSLPPEDSFVPATTGAGYELTRSLRPLAGNDADAGWSWGDVSDEISVVTGLTIPRPVDGESVPGGRASDGDWHSSTMSPLLSGVRAVDAGPRPRGETADILVARSISKDSCFESLNYRAQFEKYRDDDGLGPDDGRISFSYDASGDIVPNIPVVSPEFAHQQLFTGFVPPGDDGALRRLERDRSVLDIVRDSTASLMGRVGAEDRLRLERHFDEIRALEQRIDGLTPPVGGNCSVLSPPGPDPELATNRSDDGLIGWADETSRARSLADLVHMAFACDLTRVATLQLTFSQSFMSVEPFLGIQADLHEIGHGAGDENDVADGVAWHVETLAYLVDKFRSTPEGSGTMLDNVAIVFVAEGGMMIDGDPHTSQNMAALVAGRAGGLLPGQHLSADGYHPANVVISAMNAVGVPTEVLGEVEGELPGLRNA